MNTDDWKNSEYERLYHEVRAEKRKAGSITFPSDEEFEELRACMMNKNIEAAKQLLRIYMYAHYLKYNQHMTLSAAMKEFEDMYSEIKKGALSGNTD